MVFEIERRSKLNSEEEFDKVKSLLEEKTEFVGKKEMKSFLFRQPHYMRIRIIKGEDNVIITHKSDTLPNNARREIEFTLNYKELSKFFELMKIFGFKECACFNTLRFSYSFNGLNVDLNRIDHLGLMVEIEGITENEEEVAELDNNILSALKDLGLKELPLADYSELLKKAHSKSMKSVYEISF
jgi:predicted adenylyl cyclase CyaB